MFDIGFPELLVILALVLVLFGGKKLPELSRNLAKTIQELRKGFTDTPADTGAKTDTTVVSTTKTDKPKDA
jgi:sec-independent protein translocase protein TatA